MVMISFLYTVNTSLAHINMLLLCVRDSTSKASAVLCVHVVHVHESTCFNEMRRKGERSK